jgi:hypothetical protein
MLTGLLLRGSVGWGDAVSPASRHRVDFLQVEVSRVASIEDF